MTARMMPTACQGRGPHEERPMIPWSYFLMLRKRHQVELQTADNHEQADPQHRVFGIPGSRIVSRPPRR